MKRRIKILDKLNPKKIPLLLWIHSLMILTDQEIIEQSIIELSKKGIIVNERTHNFTISELIIKT